MGTGASLLALPDGTTWPDGDLRDGMASCVESLTELQAKLVSAGAWTAENREGLSTALDHSRGVYSKLIDEAPAHREEMQKLRGTLLTKFSEVYQVVYDNLVQPEDGFAEFNAQAALCASKAPQQKPRQETQALDELYETGAVSARTPFASLLDAARQRLPDDAEVSVAPLKKMPRTIQKSMLRADAARRGNVDDILDVVRGMVICATMSELGDALTFFSEANHGWKIVRVKNRFAAPTSGGWADCLLNIVRSDDPHQHVCEVQLVHKKMLVLRGEDMGGHDAYNQYRRADELLLAITGGRDVFAPVRHAVGMLKGLGVVTPRTPVGVCIGAGACAPHRSRSANNTTQAALKTAYSGVSNRLGGATPSLIVAAYTCTHEAKQVAEGLRELVPDTPFVGMSSCQGVVANGFWCSSKKTAPGNQTALGLWAIRDDGGDYQIIHIPDSALGDDPDDLTTRQLAQQVVADRVAAATTGRRTPSFVLCFSAFGFSEAVLEGVKDAVDVPVFGGTAADNDVTDKWSLFSSEGGVSQKGVVLVLGRSSVEVACCMTSGFKPTERKGVATKVDGYWLKEIDHEPALTVYDKWTNSESMVGLTTNSSGTTLIKDASSWQPLGVPLDDADKEFRVLHPMKADSAAGSLKLAGSVTEGTNLTLLKGDADSLVDHLLESCERIEVEAKECLGAFMILCGGLVMAMEEEIKEVYEKLADVGGKRASLGMCAFGEQGPNCNRESMHGNLMFGVLMFSNKPVRPSQVPTREPS